MVSTAGSAPGTGFLQVLQTRKLSERDSTEPQATDQQALTDIRANAFSRRPADGTVVARMTPIQANEAPPSLVQQSFAPDGRALSSGRMPPTERLRHVTFDPGMRLGDALNVVSDRGAASFRHVHANQISERVREPWYQAFHDPAQEVSLKQKFPPGGGSQISQVQLNGPYSFWTRDLTTTTDGVRQETVACNLGKLRYARESTRDGWTITEPSYASDETTGRERFDRSSVRIVTSLDGRDRLYKYDKGKLLGVDDKPIQLLT